jgi:hypothetical protein
MKRTLAELQVGGLLVNSIPELEKAGYRCNVSLSPQMDLLSLASQPFADLLAESPKPELALVHHSYAENTVDPDTKRDAELMSRAKYFPAALLRKFQLDHVPYFGSFASGCVGMLSLVIKAAGLLAYSDQNSVHCLTADARPEGANYDMLREKILTSDASSGFIFGREQKGFRVLGLSYYSSSRAVMPLVEIVKRSVQTVKDLVKAVGIELQGRDALFHYPNIFTPAWDMVSHYLKVPPERKIVDEMAERAHCLSSDSIISLKKWHHGNKGRIHVVFNFGSGLHLGVCLLEEV